MLGDKLRQLRKENNFNLEYVAHEIGVNRSAVSFWENGTNEPKASYVARLAKLYNVSADYLLGLEDETGSKIDF